MALPPANMRQKVQAGLKHPAAGSIPARRTSTGPDHSVCRAEMCSLLDRVPRMGTMRKIFVQRASFTTMYDERMARKDAAQAGTGNAKDEPILCVSNTAMTTRHSTGTGGRAAARGYTSSFDKRRENGASPTEDAGGHLGGTRKGGRHEP